MRDEHKEYTKGFIMSSYSIKIYSTIIAVTCLLTLSACEIKPARTPISKSLQITIGENEHAGSGVFDSLPDSGILVIEQIGYGVSGHYDCRTANFKLITSLPGSMNTRIHLGRTMNENTNGNAPHDSFTVRIYHDLSLGEPLEVVYARVPGGQTAYVNISFTGYIVPAGSASLAP